MMSLILAFISISIYSLILVSIDRFIVSSSSKQHAVAVSLTNNKTIHFNHQAIVFPMKYSTNMLLIKLEIASCWCFGAVIGFLPLAWHQDNTEFHGRCFYIEVISESYQYFRFITVIIIPSLMLITIYVFIYNVILHQLKNEPDGILMGLRTSLCIENCATKRPLTMTSGVDVVSLLRREIKATVNITIVVLTFMICWLPLNFCEALVLFCPSCNVPKVLITIGIPITHFHAAINPLIYAFHLKDFRDAILRLIKLK